MNKKTSVKDPFLRDPVPPADKRHPGGSHQAPDRRPGLGEGPYEHAAGLPEGQAGLRGREASIRIY